MLVPLDYTKTSPFDNYDPFQAFLERPTPRTAEELWEMEQQLYTTAAEVADQILLAQLMKAHEDKAFVEQAINQARLNSPTTLVHKGWRETSVLLSGGSRVVLKTPYLRPSRSGKRGRTRRRRGQKGSGVYPVLEALGIGDGVSPATRSEIALHTVQAASYQEAVQLLQRRGLACDVSTVVRVATATAEADISLREAALSAAMNIPVPVNGPLAGQRVRVSLDGGRVRTRHPRPGRKTRKGRRGFTTPWREPRVLVIDLLDEEGNRDSLRLPLYDVLLDDAEATFWLLVGYLRLLGAAQAREVEFIADGADWIWERIDRLMSQAEIPASILTLVIDFYHASEYLAQAVESCRRLPQKKRQQLYKRLRRILRHEPDGVQRVIEQLRHLAATHPGKKIKNAVAYFEKHAPRMAYATLDDLKLPVGSGQVESAVRRVVNLRFKAPGSFWNENTVSGLMHLRASFKAGRWGELMRRVLTREFRAPTFEPLSSRGFASVPVASQSHSSSPVIGLQEAA